MIINVKVKDATVKISCGNGRQSVRWLGSVVQSRIKQYGTLKNRFEDDNYIVTEIRNTDGHLLNPADLLCEHSDSGTLNVTATLATSFPVDEWEIPELGDWMRNAHVKSKIGTQWVNEIEAWRDSLKTLKQKKGAEGHENNILIHRAHPPSSNLIQIGHNFTESDIDSAFDLDWSIMKWDWLLPTELQKNQIGDVLKSNYAVVCNFFAHYCGVGQVGQRYGLTMQEFGHLLHHMRVCNFKTSDDMIEDIFYKTGSVTSGSGSTAGGKWPLMTRAHLAQALLCAALLEKAEDCPDAEALKLFFSGRMATLWSKLTAKYFYYTSQDPVVKKSTLEYYQLLKHVFQMRATTDSKYGPRLTVSSFISMIQEVGLIEPEQESVCVGSFLEAQLSPATVWELEDLVLCEFLEALARVAVKVIEQYKGSTFTDAKRIRMAFNFVAELNDTGAPRNSHK